MADHYRQRNDSDTWHFCSNCSNWPTSDYKRREAKPSTGELCNQCQAKRDDNNCS